MTKNNELQKIVDALEYRIQCVTPKFDKAKVSGDKFEEGYYYGFISATKLVEDNLISILKGESK